MKRIITIILATLLALIIISCKEDTVSSGGLSDNVFMAQFQQGILPSSAFNGMYDTYFKSGSPNNIYADCLQLYLGEYGTDTCRIGFSCDLTSIPSTATVVKAYLTFTTGTLSSQVMTASAYAQPKYWWPGASGCDVNFGNDYDARWNGPWTTDGGDLSRPMSTEASVSMGSSNRALTFELNKTIVQNWVRNGVSSSPDANFGLIIKSTNEASGTYITVYNSKITLLTFFRPILTVYYTIPF